MNYILQAEPKSFYAGETLEDYGISFENPSSILSVTPAELWKLIKNTVISKVTAPLRLLVSLGIVVVLTALAESLGDTVKKGVRQRFMSLYAFWRELPPFQRLFARFWQIRRRLWRTALIL